MIIEKYRHPVKFYVLSTITPWTFWFVAAYISHITPTSEWLGAVVSILAIIGLCAPALIAFWMIGFNHDLFNDLKGRLFNFKIKPTYLFLTCFLMLASILLAQAISLIFGYSIDQFTISGKSSFSGGDISGWYWLFFAPFIEELAWHSYGADCLRRRMNLLYTSLLFSIYWAFWHYPAFLIKGYYHSNLEEIGFVYSLNFMVSIVPFVILMNWLYYKTNRNILVAIIFHITAGFFNELFNTDPNSKIIQTIILTILSIVLITKEKDFFLKRKYTESGYKK